MKPVDPGRFTLAVLDLEDQLRSQGKEFRPLTLGELGQYKTEGFRPVQGWEFELIVADSTVLFVGLIDPFFPLSPPRFVIPDKSLVLKYPHIGEDGAICLLSPHDIYIPGVYLPQSSSNGFMHLLDLAQKNLIAGANGGNAEDFHDEFLSYWNIFCNRKHHQITNSYSILDLNSNATRNIFYLQRGKTAVFSDTEESGREWFMNLLQIQKAKFKTHLQCGWTILVWLSAPLLPNEFPKTSGEFFKLAETAPAGHVDEIKDYFRKIVPCQGEMNLPILIGFESVDGPALAGLRAYEPRRFHGFSPNGLQNYCFPRPDRIAKRKDKPRKTVSRLFYNPSTPMEPFAVDRADLAWLQFRGGRGKEAGLSDLKVAILGCGSLGSQLAAQIAKDGVGHLTLYDHDYLSVGNVGRHLLGMEYVGRNKVEGVATYLKRNFPHLKVEPIKSTWKDAYLDHDGQTKLQSHDVIVSLVGDTNSDMTLNYLASKNSMLPAIIYGYTEAYGCAGHAILVDGDCLQCGIGPDGKYLAKVVSWNGSPLKKAPACGETFAPYGSIETGPIVAMIARLVLDYLTGRTANKSAHRVWIGHVSLVKESGGKWNKNWIMKHGDPSEGEFSLRLPWDKNPECALCG